MKKYFEKTEIASYTDVSAFLCVAQSNHPADWAWKFRLYGNICWDGKTNILYHCGKYDRFSYAEFENEDEIVLEKLPQNSTADEIRAWLDRDYYFMFPINTYLLGITERPFKHNVFVTGYEGSEFIVYDYWHPDFSWKYQMVDGDKLFGSVDFSNLETVQAFYAFRCSGKNNPAGMQAEKVDLNQLFEHDWGENPCYDRKNNTYGTSAYGKMLEYMESTGQFSLSVCQNFFVIYDHLKFQRTCLEHMCVDRTGIGEILVAFDDMIKKANRLKTYVYVQYLGKKTLDSVKDRIIEGLKQIRNDEEKAIERLRQEEFGRNINESDGI